MRTKFLFFFVILSDILGSSSNQLNGHRSKYHNHDEGKHSKDLRNKKSLSNSLNFKL